jgi:diacylglycerol kinase (ATP)
MDWMLVYNPSARAGERAAARLEAILATHPLPQDINLDWTPIDELGNHRRKPGRVIAVGGDGTASQSAEWIVEHGYQVPLAIIPAGTGNNLAQGLGIPTRMRAAAGLAFQGSHLRLLDAGRLIDVPTGQHCLMIQSACLGFPSEMSARFAALRQKPLWRPWITLAGTYAYRVIAALGLEGQKRKEKRGEGLLMATCQIGDEKFSETVLAILLGNERSLGGNFYPCPLAVVDDGLLDLCLIRSGTGVNYWKLFHDVTRGKHLRYEEVVLYRQFSEALEIMLTRKEPVLVDGDIRFESDHLRLEVLPQCLPVVVP